MLSNETVKSLLISGFLCPRKQDADGNTLLHLALFQDNPTLALTLIDFATAVSDTLAINLANKEGDTPLHVAARHFPQDTLILELVDAGAKLGIPNNNDEVVDFPYRKKTRRRAAIEEKEILDRIEKRMSSQAAGQDSDFPDHLSIESNFSPKNDLLMPF